MNPGPAVLATVRLAETALIALGMPQRPEKVITLTAPASSAGGPYPVGKEPSRVSTSRHGGMATSGKTDDGRAWGSRSPDEAAWSWAPSVPAQRADPSTNERT